MRCIADVHGLAVQEDDSMESQLQQVSAKHAESSRLADVLASLCTALGIECEALQDGAGGGVPDEAAANDVADMEDEDEEAADDSGDEDGEDSEDAYDMAEDDDQDRTVSNCVVVQLEAVSRWRASRDGVVFIRPLRTISRRVVYDVQAEILQKLTRWTNMEEVLSPPKSEADDKDEKEKDKVSWVPFEVCSRHRT
jgi:hypothetical protein